MNEVSTGDLLRLDREIADLRIREIADLRAVVRILTHNDGFYLGDPGFTDAQREACDRALNDEPE